MASYSNKSIWNEFNPIPLDEDYLAAREAWAAELIQQVLPSGTEPINGFQGQGQSNPSQIIQGDITQEESTIISQNIFNQQFEAFSSACIKWIKNIPETEDINFSEIVLWSLKWTNEQFESCFREIKEELEAQNQYETKEENKPEFSEVLERYNSIKFRIEKRRSISGNTSDFTSTCVESRIISEPNITEAEGGTWNGQPTPPGPSRPLKPQANTTEDEFGSTPEIRQVRFSTNEGFLEQLTLFRTTQNTGQFGSPQNAPQFMLSPNIEPLVPSQTLEQFAPLQNAIQFGIETSQNPRGFGIENLQSLGQFEIQNSQNPEQFGTEASQNLGRFGIENLQNPGRYGIETSQNPGQFGTETSQIQRQFWAENLQSLGQFGIQNSQNPDQFGTEASQNPRRFGIENLQNPGQFGPSPHQGQLESVPKTGHFRPPQTPGPSSSQHQKSDFKPLKEWSLWHMTPSKKMPCNFQKRIKNHPDVNNALRNCTDGPLLDGESYYFIPVEIHPSKIEELVQNRLVCFVKPIPTDWESSPTVGFSFLGVEWSFLIKTLIEVNYDDCEFAGQVADMYRPFIMGAVMERQKTSGRSWNQRICVLLSAHSREQLGTFLINYFRSLLLGIFENERIFYDGDAHPNLP